MAAHSWLKDIIRWITVTFGTEFIVTARDWLQHKWRGLFASRNILVLGPKQTGKTSLVFLLQHDRPYEVVDGEIRAPNPTAAAAIVDKKFPLQHGNWLKLKRDVPGDLDLRDTWAQAINDVRPHGIIYMLDGRLDDKQLRVETSMIRENVLRHYADSLGELRALHVFLNFADAWATSPAVVRSSIRVVTEELERVLDGSSALQHLRIGVSATQLSPHKKSWEEATRAVYKFGADLAD